MSTPSILRRRGTTAASNENRVGFKLPTADDIDVEMAFREAGKLNSMNSNYRHMITVLRDTDTDDEALVKLLKRIKNYAPLIERHNDEVLESVLKINLLKRGIDVMDAFSHLACDMVCIHPMFLRNVVVALAGTFMSPEATLKETEQREEKLARLHKLLQQLFKLVPTAPLVLVEVLAEVFPYMKRDGRQQASLVGQLLRVTTYIPDHRLELLKLLTHKALQIDLHCPKDEINDAELEENDDDAMESDLFPMEKEGEADPERMQHPLADILDQVLNEFYLFFQQQCNVKGDDLSKLDWEKTKTLFKDLLAIFDKIILPTHKCCHLQFFLFYLCSYRPAVLGVAFFDYLWKKVQNPATSSVLRQASAFYIGSFLARAKFVPLSTVCASLSLLCQWAHAYMSSLNDGGFGGQLQHDVRRHGTFYAVCQTVFYVFAFHHRNIVEGEKGLEYLRSLNLEALVMCPLNPLKACLPAVVQQFASIARHYQLVYCYSVIERNQRFCLPTATGGEALGGDVVLDAFFPFDPYLLKRTGKWINPLYRKFEKPQEDVDVDDDLEDDDDEEMVCKSPKSSSTLAEMFTYGASPGFKRSVPFAVYR